MTERKPKLKPKPYSIQRRVAVLRATWLLLTVWLIAVGAWVGVTVEREIASALAELRRALALQSESEIAIAEVITEARNLHRAHPARSPAEREALAARLGALLDEYEKLNLSGLERAHVGQIRSHLEGMLSAFARMGNVRPASPESLAELDEVFRQNRALQSEMHRLNENHLSRMGAVHSGLRRQTRAIYAMLAALAALALLSVLLFTRAQQRHLWAPLENLRQTVQAYRRGRFDARPEMPESVELRPLAETLAEMARETEETRHRLEEKVVERTARLEQAQQQLLRAARLSALGQLVTGVAHEVNNPLTSILGFSDVLLARGDLPPALRPQVETIRQEALRLKNVVSNLTNFSEQARPRLVRLDLRTVVERLAELRQYQLRASNIRLVFLPPRTPVWVEADPDQMLQVFFSLVLNAEQAIGASGAGGTIRIELMEEDGGVIAHVSDTGGGIPPELVDRVFEPFFTTRPQTGSAGMGLAVARSIVEQHGGRLSVASEEGGGSTFLLELPAPGRRAPEAPAPEPDRSSLAERPAAPRRALVIDDERGILELVAAALGTRGWECVLLDDPGGLEAALAAEEHHLVLCDLKMPGRSGLEVLRLLRRARSELARQFVLMTGDPSDIAGHAEEFADVVLLRKPFTVARLFEAIDEALRRAA